jgi:C1A family cysteine protease
MRTMHKLAIAALIGTFGFAAACGPDEPADTGEKNTQATNEDVDAPLENLAALTYGAPPESELPQEGKADAVYPRQFFDLVQYQSPVKSQGSRGVCSIFSAVGLMEHLYIKEGTITNPDFSEQYLQWSVKEQVGAFRNTSGSNSNSNLQAINRFGVPEEAYWPYETFAWGTSQNAECTGDEDKRPVVCHTNGEPPQTARDARKYKLPTGRWVSTNPRNIKGFMTNNQQAVIVGGDFYYQSWNHRRSELPTNNEYWREGYVLYPNAADKEKSRVKPAGHSILIVGWNDDLEVQLVDGEGNKVFDANGNPVTEKGFYLFKNSWGTGSFGVNNPHCDGCGWISMRYVQEFKSAYGSGLPTVDWITPEPQPVEEVCGQNLECSDPRCVNEAACSGETQVYTAEVNAAIPDNNPTGLTSELVVEDAMTIGALNVEVFIEHSYIGDLRIALQHPDGTIATLKAADGRAGRDLAEVYRVEGFDGKNTAGTWKLVVTDTAALDTGSLLEWSLVITP